MDVNWTYFVDHFIIYTYARSLYCISKTDMLYVNYISLKKEGKKAFCSSIEKFQSLSTFSGKKKMI